MQNPAKLFSILIFLKKTKTEKNMTAIKGFLDPHKSQSLKLLQLSLFSKRFFHRQSTFYRCEISS